LRCGRAVAQRAKVAGHIAAPALPPTRGMRCSSRPPYRRASRFFWVPLFDCWWVPSGLGSRFSWCLDALCPLLLVSATRLPNKSRPNQKIPGTVTLFTSTTDKSDIPTHPSVDAGHGAAGGRFRSCSTRLQHAYPAPCSRLAPHLQLPPSALCPLLFVSATRLPNKTRPQSKSDTFQIGKKLG